MRLAVLIGGYGLVLVSYAWTWMIASAFSQECRAQKTGVAKKDISTVLTVMGFWTVLWLVIQLVDGLG